MRKIQVGLLGLGTVGMGVYKLLRKRAEDILEMVGKTVDEFKELDNITGGEVHIGCAESYQIKYLAQAIKSIKKNYPLFLHEVRPLPETVQNNDC